MDLKLAGRTALVTGATMGIGYVTAETLAREGTAVAITGRSSETIRDAVTRIGTAVPGAKIQGIVADAGTAEGTAVICSELSTVDILVNNLGIYERRPFLETSDDEWRRYFEINVLSGVRMSRHYLPAMRERGWGRVLFISSESGLNIPADMIHYGVSKVAQIALARGLAIEFAGTGVTVNSVLPGPTKTAGVARSMQRRAEQANKTVDEVEMDYFRMARPTSLIRRFADPQEVANLVAYLAGEGSSATTGAAVRVEGGIVASLP